MKHAENHPLTVIPETVVTVRPAPEGPAIVTTGAVTLPGAIRIIPVDSDDPVLSASVTSCINDENETVFLFKGKTSVPWFEKNNLMELSGNLRTVQQPDGSFTVHESRAEAILPRLTFASFITITDGRILLAGCRYTTTFRLQGTIQYRNRSQYATGTIDTPLPFSAADQPSRGVATLITQARIRIPSMPSLENGTIRFCYHTGNSFIRNPVRDYDENDELLFQMSEPVMLGTMNITGIPEAPLTLWVELQSFMREPSRLLLGLFPCRLTTEYTGTGTVLFLHGRNYDEPFTLQTDNPWQASVSSNVFLYLVAPDDPSGKALVTATVFLEGTLKGHGMRPPALRLSVNGIMQGTAFSDTTVARTLPDQPFSFSISSDGNPDCTLEMETPLHLADGSVMFSPDADSGRVRCSLCREGLCFEKIRMRKKECTEPVPVNRCIVNGEGRIVRIA